MNFKYTSRSEADTLELAENIESEKFPGMVICLDGELGSGKTVFVKGFAKAINIKESVTSPTFTLLKTYEGKDYTLVHVDAYRLEGSSFEELDDYLSDENVIFIEWSSCISNTDFIDNYLSIDIKYKSKNQRDYILNGVGKRYEEMLKELSENE
jgi:tRNA threonylcarbamoyladenosine biosynthesis protein TsaE